MKTLLVALSVLFLAACTPSAKVKEFPVLPDELKDCKFFRLEDGNATAAITVARCPNSTTTVRQSNKAGTTTVIIDGQEYAPK